MSYPARGHTRRVGIDGKAIGASRRLDEWEPSMLQAEAAE
jgi:hypothetical protein